MFILQITKMYLGQNTNTLNKSIMLCSDTHTKSGMLRFLDSLQSLGVDSNQIWRTCHFVAFIVSRLIYFCINFKITQTIYKLRIYQQMQNYRKKHKQ